MGDYGLKIAKDGYDVKTTPDINLAISSKFNSLKIFAEGALTQSVAPSTNYTITVTHNLGYRPGFLVFGENNVGGIRRYQADYVDGAAYVSCRASVNTTQLIINLSAGASTTTGTLNLYYYIFIDPSTT